VRFVLASESARRVDLLRRMGYNFEIRKSGFPEVLLTDPKETVEANARGKALAVAESSGEVVLAADTIVYQPDLPAGERVLGQATSEQDVRRMLESLSGRLHEVHSAVAVVCKEELEVRHAVAKVRMRSLGEEEIQGYARLGEGVGKAGGYAIQGRAALLVEWIGGDYTCVVGLPLALTSRMLAGFGIKPYLPASPHT